MFAKKITLNHYRNIGMSGITEVHKKPISESKYIKLNNVEFMENGLKRSWDYVTVRLSVFF